MPTRTASCIRAPSVGGWRRWLGACALAIAALAPASAAARPVRTGGSSEVSRRPRALVRHVYWANQVSELEATVTAFPGRTRVGDKFDLVDESGYFGRVTVVEVDDATCGEVKYQQALTRFVGDGPSREVAGLLVALSPALRAPALAHVQTPDDVRSPPPAGKHNLLQGIDLDGDRAPDLARYMIYNCKARALKSPDGNTCIETWGREGGTWRLLERAEFPPCN